MDLLKIEPVCKKLFTNQPAGGTLCTGNEFRKTISLTRMTEKGGGSFFQLQEKTMWIYENFISWFPEH